MKVAGDMGNICLFLTSVKPTKNVSSEVFTVINITADRIMLLSL
jgi:hypothetical protein